MRVLWITNVVLPEASELIGEKPSPYGGWLVNSSKALSSVNNVDLIIASPRVKIDKTQEIIGQNINYLLFPWHAKVNDKNDSEVSELKRIIKKNSPDIVHIYGTEYSHSNAAVEICNQLGISNVVSIQGLVSIYSYHYMASLDYKVQKQYSLRDFIKKENLIKSKGIFTKKGELESDTLKKTKHIIGRTTWDLACASQVNPKATYHFCNETLREKFYAKQWSYSECEKYSIFASQASYPIKGVHFLIEALPYIVSRFPKTKLYISGKSLYPTSIFEKLKMTAYSKYILSLIDKYNLKDHVIFTGTLNEEEMVNQYLNSNLFVCPSSIENSPNSLGEAMLLGVPCVASYVGGVPDMLENLKEGYLYQHDAHYMLAHYVCRIFSDVDLAEKFSKNARKRAKETHHIANNRDRLIGVYENILK